MESVEDLYDAVNNLYINSFETNMILELTHNINELIINSPTFENNNKDVFSLMMLNISYNIILK